MSSLIILRGPLGSGKSTIAKKLASHLHGESISIDDILDEHRLNNDLEEGYISQKSFLTANDHALEKARPLLEKNIPVIIEGNFYWKSQVEDLQNRLPSPPHIFTLHAPLELCIQRDRDRHTPHGEDATRAVHKKVSEFDAGIPIDAAQTFDRCVSDILTKK